MIGAVVTAVALTAPAAWLMGWPCLADAGVPLTPLRRRLPAEQAPARPETHRAPSWAAR